MASRPAQRVGGQLPVLFIEVTHQCEQELGDHTFVLHRAALSLSLLHLFHRMTCKYFSSSHRGLCMSLGKSKWSQEMFLYTGQKKSRETDIEEFSFLTSCSINLIFIRYGRQYSSTCFSICFSYYFAHKKRKEKP